MRLFELLFGRAQSVKSEPPVLSLNGSAFVPSSIGQLEIVDAGEEEKERTRVDDADKPETADLEHVFCVIEYVDAEGNETRRRITMQSLVAGRHSPLVHAVCHERRALRHFRVDRIKSIITHDGEIFSAHRFFVEILGVDPRGLSKPDGDVNGEGSLLRARRWREQLRAPLSILVCAGLSDGHYHIEEVDRIQVYAEAEVFSLHGDGKILETPDIETMDHLCRMIGAMRPQRSSMRGYIETICEWSEARVDRLARALLGVVLADGRVADEESEFVAEMNEFARASQAERLGMLSSTAFNPFEEMR